MSMRSNIIKLLSATLSILIAAGILVLLVAAINKRNNKTCSGLKIEFNTKKDGRFVDEKEILNLLTANGNDKIVGRTIASIDLRKKQKMIEENKWIRDAQVFFDNNEVLRVTVVERAPVARVFTNDGKSFYIDSGGALLPLPDKLPVKVPVFTNFPHPKLWLRGTDSILIRQITELSGFILKDPFWAAQIEQVNIKPDKGFEMVPSVGSHLIVFGDGRDIEQKFHRLLIFYREVMSKTGFGKYGKIDLRYDGQVVATRRGASVAKVDSLKAAKNIEQLIRSAQQMQTDDYHLQNTLPLEHNSVTERSLTNYDLVPNEDENQSDTAIRAAKKQQKSIKKKLNNQK
jgi:cell division protein FtsQ